MKSYSAASAYKESTFDIAPPIKIIHMMYEGALRYLCAAERADPKTEFRTFNENLNRAEAVVAELRISVSHEHSPDLGRQLDALYLFVEHQIREAFLEHDPDPIANAKQVLQTLLEAWRQIEVDLGKSAA